MELKIVTEKYPFETNTATNNNTSYVHTRQYVKIQKQNKHDRIDTINNSYTMTTVFESQYHYQEIKQNRKFDDVTNKKVVQ